MLDSSSSSTRSLLSLEAEISQSSLLGWMSWPRQSKEQVQTLSTLTDVGAGQFFGSNPSTFKIGAGLCLGGMLVEFLSFSGFSLIVLHFGYRYRQNKEIIPEPEVRVKIVDRIMIALYINMAGQFVWLSSPPI